MPRRRRAVDEDSVAVVEAGRLQRSSARSEMNDQLGVVLCTSKQIATNLIASACWLAGYSATSGRGL